MKTVYQEKLKQNLQARREKESGKPESNDGELRKNSANFDSGHEKKRFFKKDSKMKFCILNTVLEINESQRLAKDCKKAKK
jgi:hypothetical protein